MLNLTITIGMDTHGANCYPRRLTSYLAPVFYWLYTDVSTIAMHTLRPINRRQSKAACVPQSKSIYHSRHRRLLNRRFPQHGTPCDYTRYTCCSTSVNASQSRPLTTARLPGTGGFEADMQQVAGGTGYRPGSPGLRTPIPRRFRSPPSLHYPALSHPSVHRTAPHFARSPRYLKDSPSIYRTHPSLPLSRAACHLQ
ncbi:hypothetical protein EJ06DRAFT_346315 [Trichodelitschia bisporula]|uniref:Uncharacterized protein n=1 Tax=Trichodelitschia bisporula TaxID=703511 RepID=A0A6G1I317_9PEZI|nr:hypothetical protein EJ06DRAFT_346315 [Trichodelitschia bisporula]